MPNKIHAWILMTVVAVGAQAVVVDWQGGAGNWTADNWTVDGTADSTYGNTIDADTVTVSTGAGNVLSQTASIIFRNSGTLNVTNGTLDITGNLGDTANASKGTITIDAATLTLSGIINLDRNDVHFSMVNSAIVQAGGVWMENTGRSSLVFDGGSLTLTNANAIRGSNFGLGLADIKAAAGEFSVTHTDLSDGEGRTLAWKVAQGFFRMDGIVLSGLNASGAPALDLDVDVLNMELASAANTTGDGRHFFIDQSVAGQQTLNVIPEPAVISFICIFGGSMLWIKRRLS